LKLSNKNPAQLHKNTTATNNQKPHGSPVSSQGLEKLLRGEALYQLQEVFVKVVGEVDS